MPLASTDLPEPDADLLHMEVTPVTARRPKILVVEDDRDLALLLRRQLEADGYQVVLAGSGEDAIWLAREEQPQLITLDIMLPDMDGFVVLERLKEHPMTAGIPVVIASVLRDAEEHKGYSLGAVDYVVKPFAEDKLLAAVRRALAALDSTQPHRVLVVDDDPDILSLMEEALSFHGYQVDTASHGQAALDRIGEVRPDLMLLDIRMPEMDGYDVIRHLKADQATRDIPIVVITASPVDKERDRVRVLGMGADQYVTKPLSIEGLILEIKKAIAERAPE
jgi:DNA-binding response OmpR family regulator